MELKPDIWRVVFGKRLHTVETVQTYWFLPLRRTGPWKKALRFQRSPTSSWSSPSLEQFFADDALIKLARFGWAGEPPIYIPSQRRARNPCSEADIRRSRTRFRLHRPGFRRPGNPKTVPDPCFRQEVRTDNVCPHVHEYLHPKGSSDKPAIWNCWSTGGAARASAPLGLRMGGVRPGQMLEIEVGGTWSRRCWRGRAFLTAAGRPEDCSTWEAKERRSMWGWTCVAGRRGWLAGQLRLDHLRVGMRPPRRPTNRAGSPIAASSPRDAPQAVTRRLGRTGRPARGVLPRLPVTRISPSSRAVIRRRRRGRPVRPGAPEESAARTSLGRGRR